MNGTIFGQVVLRQLLPDFTCSDANNRMLTGIEVMWELEQVHSDRALFESDLTSSNGVLDDVGEEVSATFTCAKSSTLQYMIKLRTDGLLSLFAECFELVHTSAVRDRITIVPDRLTDVINR